MKNQLEFVKHLYKDLESNFRKHLFYKEETKKRNSWYSENYMNKNHSKTALKRKITYLRQELLNLERMLDE